MLFRLESMPLEKLMQQPRADIYKQMSSFARERRNSDVFSSGLSLNTKKSLKRSPLLKYMNQLPKVQNKYYHGDKRGLSFSQLIVEEDLPPGKWKTAAQRYKELIPDCNYQDISFGDLGLEDGQDSDERFLNHLRIIYG